MYVVQITNRAQNELDGAHEWWAKNRSSDQAQRWYHGFVDALLALENEPERFPLAPESDSFPYDVRQLNYGLSGRPTHRALFIVRHEQVVVLRVRHVAQKPLSFEDI